MRYFEGFYGGRIALRFEDPVTCKKNFNRFVDSGAPPSTEMFDCFLHETTPFLPAIQCLKCFCQGSADLDQARRAPQFCLQVKDLLEGLRGAIEFAVVKLEPSAQCEGGGQFDREPDFRSRFGRFLRQCVGQPRVTKRACELGE